MKSINFKEFVKIIHEEFKNTTIEQIEQILDIGENFTKDTPVSTGKRLIITNISFEGQKISEEGNSYSGKLIKYSNPLDSGLNIWIADNLKGKSSIFKILKYGLTGVNSLKANIKKWIKLILINFKINEKEYSIFLDCRKKSLTGMLLSCNVPAIEKVDDYLEQILFKSNGEAEYQSNIQDFFFKQFTYYSLKWTQKSSQKDKNELWEVGASWKTYFKSIFLESSDSSVIFGDQGKKIFQMLLGLEFTYAINYYSVEKDKLLFERAKRNSVQKEEDISQIEKIDKLKNRLLEIEQQLSTFTVENKSKLDLTEFYKDRENLLNSVVDNNYKIKNIQEKIEIEKTQIEAIKEKRRHNDDTKSQLEKEIRKTEKHISDLKEYIEIGIFFSNLNITKCPSCNHHISEHEKHDALRAKVCSVCHEEIKTEQEKDDKEIYKEKIENLQIVISGLKSDLESLEKQKGIDNYDLHSANVIKFSQELERLVSMTDISERLTALNDILNQETTIRESINNKREELIAEKAIINYQLQEKISPTISSLTNNNLKIEVYDKAINELGHIRLKLSENVLNRLSGLMLEEIHQMGLKSISEIKINENFDIKYKQDGDIVGFDDIAEGEKLRAKLAFYLSLIQMDIEYNYGRHTRFLIIDSPAKEEADANYMSGLKDLLSTIQQRFGTQLQILIGTAERSLENIVSNENVTPEGEFIF